MTTFMYILGDLYTEEYNLDLQDFMNVERSSFGNRNSHPKSEIRAKWKWAFIEFAELPWNGLNLI